MKSTYLSTAFAHEVAAGLPSVKPESGTACPPNGGGQAPSGLALSLAIPGPLRQCFAYLPPPGVDPSLLKPGVRMEVPFGPGNTIVVGYFMGPHQQEGMHAALKPALSLLDSEPLVSAGDCDILRWASRYYHHPLGEVFATAFPVLLRQAVHERVLYLTSSGRTALASKRARRQAQLLEVLQSREAGIPWRELQGLGWNVEGAVKALAEKGWVGVRLEANGLSPPPQRQERWLCLTELGLYGPAVKLSTSQAELFQVLRQRGGSIALHELDRQDRRRARTVQVLVDKGLASFQILDGLGRAEADAPPGPVYTLNASQQNAFDAVLASMETYRTFLLEGVTGSGKTEVYLRLVDVALRLGRQALVLVPEINLTPQLEARFRSRFAAPLVVFHSGLGEQERCRAWLSMQRGDASILLGTRSAVFTPLAKPGIFILDEEHDISYKQQEGFRFNARDVAVMRARQMQIPLVMGSATPSLESLHNVRLGRYERLRLPERTGLAVPPLLRLVDIRNQRLVGGLSPSLLAQIGHTLGRGEQVLLFVNRRGFAPTLICHACGWVAECPNCDARMVVHAADRLLRCHHCGWEQAPLRDCPHCHTADLRPLGLGTERVEQALEKQFPNARTLRIDRDSTRRKGSLEKMLDEIHAGKVDILLGTQMLAKGHHFPRVTLAGLLDVDGGLFSLDFRASERTAQLIVQVAGRAGREERPGLVLLQTRQPDHPLLLKLVRQGYSAFADAALEERREAELPPYSYQALWRAEAVAPEAASRFLARLGALSGAGGEVLVLGPVPAPLFRQAKRFRYQLLLQCNTRKPLREVVEHLICCIPQLPEARGVRWSVDVDPADLY